MKILEFESRCVAHPAFRAGARAPVAQIPPPLRRKQQRMARALCIPRFFFLK